MTQKTLTCKFTDVKISNLAQTERKFDTERFNLKRLNDVEVKEHYQVKISSRFVALESIRENIKCN